MLHPSYTELMNAVNKDVEEGEKPIVNSRYSIVIATARRARQIIAGAESTVPDFKNKKPLSVAVEEIMDGSVKVLSGGADIEDDEEKPIMTNDVYDISLDVDDEEIFEDELHDDEETDEEDTASDSEEDAEDLSSEEDDYE
jgi:DNA-directed RNA polymerase subunit omega